jgi:hypothetical protein
VIEGAVMTFVDITEVVRVREALAVTSVDISELKRALAENDKLVAELIIANNELAFQNEEKEKRAQEALQMAAELRRLKDR